MPSLAAGVRAADYRWLAALQVGGPTTPLDALLATLATTRPDRALESFRLRLSRIEGQTPLDHGCVALVGLRLLPPADPNRPALPPALFGGLIRFAEGLARDLTHEALQLEPSNHNNWAALGLALDAAGDWTRARAVFRHARRRFPHSPFVHSQLGHALLEIQGPDAALPVLRTGVRDHPDNLPLRSDYTDALIQAGSLAEVEQQLETAWRIAARNGLAYAAALGESTLFWHAGEPVGRERPHRSGSQSKSGSGLAPDTDTDPDLDVGDVLAPHLSPLASAAQGAASAAIGAGLAGGVRFPPGLGLFFFLCLYLFFTHGDIRFGSGLDMPLTRRQEILSRIPLYNLLKWFRAQSGKYQTHILIFPKVSAC